MSAGAAVWDTAFENNWTGQNGNAQSVQLPCYQAESPVGGYTGGNQAYMMMAWGNSQAAREWV